jgi:hypothetical protein
MRIRTLVPAVLLLALVAAACSKSPTSPDGGMSQADADDVAQQIAVVSTGTGWGAFVLNYGGTMAPQLAPARVRPARVAQPAAWDTTWTSGFLTYTFALAFFTQGGDEQGTYDPATTWRIEETSGVTGSIQRTDFQANLFHTGAMTYFGTRSSDDTLTFSGTAHDTALTHFVSDVRQVERWFHVDLTRTVANVTLPRTAYAYPTSGMVTWVVTATRLRSSSRGDVEATLNAIATLAFNGTRYPTLVVSGRWRYRVDLISGAVSRL